LRKKAENVAKMLSIMAVRDEMLGDIDARWGWADRSAVQLCEL
jgi:hypothetical protein